MTKRDYGMLWAYVDNTIRAAVLTLAKAKGVSISEYIRSLILEDLDKRTYFTAILKNKAQEVSENVKE